MLASKGDLVNVNENKENLGFIHSWETKRIERITDILTADSQRGESTLSPIWVLAMHRFKSQLQVYSSIVQSSTVSISKVFLTGCIKNGNIMSIQFV